VLLDECLRALALKPEGIYIDGTAGGAGHSRAIAGRLTVGRLVAIDRDPEAVAAARERLAAFPSAAVVRGNFQDMVQIAAAEGITAADGILLDLGVSSHQLDSGERGFSYHADAPLDMRMSGEGLSARDVVNGWAEDRLARILSEYGEERFAWRIARHIAEVRLQAPIETTGRLAEVVKEAIPAATPPRGRAPRPPQLSGDPHRSQRRLENLDEGLGAAVSLLKPGGRLAVITFHSLEDRMVKQRFASYTKAARARRIFRSAYAANSLRPGCHTGSLSSLRRKNFSTIPAAAAPDFACWKNCKIRFGFGTHKKGDGQNHAGDAQKRGFIRFFRFGAFPAKAAASAEGGCRAKAQARAAQPHLERPPLCWRRW
jgi:16S rRNA (cytosine1402-N4)-methyltransferase